MASRVDRVPVDRLMLTQRRNRYPVASRNDRVAANKLLTQGRPVAGGDGNRGRERYHETDCLVLHGGVTALFGVQSNSLKWFADVLMSSPVLRELSVNANLRSHRPWFLTGVSLPSWSSPQRPQMVGRRTHEFQRTSGHSTDFWACNQETRNKLTDFQVNIAPGSSLASLLPLWSSSQKVRRRTHEFPSPSENCWWR